MVIHAYLIEVLLFHKLNVNVERDCWPYLMDVNDSRDKLVHFYLSSAPGMYKLKQKAVSLLNYD